MMRVLIAALLAAVLASAACADPVIDAADYDQSCGDDDDCIIVFAGNVCGCGTQAAVNVDVSAELEADAGALRQSCIGNPFCNDGDCFIQSFIAECVDGVCAAVPEPRPPIYSFAGPFADVVIPTNAVITGSIVPGTDPDEVLRAFVSVDGGEPREVPFRQAHCDDVNGCEDVIELGPLLPNATARLTFDPPSEGEAQWLTGDGADATPPVVEELVVENVGVFRDQTKRMFKQVSLRYAEPTDDFGVTNYGIVRTVDGGAARLIERIAANSTGFVHSESHDEADGAREACYALLAWDHAGNEAQTDFVCVDVTISEEEQRSIPSCANARSIPVTVVLALMVVSRRRIRPAR